MGKRTSIYLPKADLERLENLGNPGLLDIFRLGLDAAEGQAGLGSGVGQWDGPVTSTVRTGRGRRGPSSSIPAPVRFRPPRGSGSPPSQAPGSSAECPHPRQRRDRKSGLCRLCGVNVGTA